MPTRHNVDAELRFCHTELHPLLNVLCTPPHKLWATSLGLTALAGCAQRAEYTYMLFPAAPQKKAVCGSTCHKVVPWKLRAGTRAAAMSKEGACSVVVKVLFLWLTMLSVGLWLVACGLLPHVARGTWRLVAATSWPTHYTTPAADEGTCSNATRWLLCCMSD